LKEVWVSVSYFRRKADQCYRHARLTAGPQNDSIIQRLGDEFTAKADAAVARLTNLRATLARRREVERRSAYSDRRE
jgi:hypothetical protein